LRVISARARVTGALFAYPGSGLRHRTDVRIMLSDAAPTFAVWAEVPTDQQTFARRPLLVLRRTVPGRAPVAPPLARRMPAYYVEKSLSY